MLMNCSSEEITMNNDMKNNHSFNKFNGRGTQTSAIKLVNY
ncbi:MAG: hypothetical protein ACI37Z_01080 [Candidatus Gastranaerophilaceae bacterium]